MNTTVVVGTWRLASLLCPDVKKCQLLGERVWLYKINEKVYRRAVFFQVNLIFVNEN